MLAASLIPLHESPYSTPIALGGSGFDEGTQLFAIDHAGMRFYMSALKNQDSSVSKAGMLLLNKQDALRHRGRHERMINTLRLRSLILPAESGTIVRGKDDLVRRIDFRLNALLEILLGLTRNTTWRMQVGVLDSRIQHVYPSDTAPVRPDRQNAERGRGSTGQKRTDTKTLDRLLTREKKLAETILHSISTAAESHEVEYLIGLAGGSSDSWKVILKAVFHVPLARYPHFMKAVVECQELHAMVEPMLQLAGGTESFSLSM